MTLMDTQVGPSLIRFETNASQEERKQFATDLVAALDQLRVRPGQRFIVTDEESLAKLIEDAEEKADAERRAEDAENKASAAEARASEDAALAQKAEELIDALEDVQRGVRTLDEVMELLR